ncbi:hypothetical protein X777_07864 [Ooceraea biroi]|uniref:Uncharacterized protein n=1 Tax=Ooceraea biroi TaxID=2015173 RepID=A0A026X0K2_OOCBI|nr:hypothetical protein X777_07864 [Ooceraea biroi]
MFASIFSLSKELPTEPTERPAGRPHGIYSFGLTTTSERENFCSDTKKQSPEEEGEKKKEANRFDSVTSQAKRTEDKRRSRASEGQKQHGSSSGSIEKRPIDPWYYADVHVSRAKVSRVTRSLGPRDVTEDPIAGSRGGEKAMSAEEEIRAKRNRNVASKRSRHPGERLLNFDQVETADARRAAQK